MHRLVDLLSAKDLLVAMLVIIVNIKFNGMQISRDVILNLAVGNFPQQIRGPQIARPN